MKRGKEDQNNKSPASPININEFVNLVFPKGTSRLLSEAPNWFEEFEDKVKEGVWLRQLEFIKPAGYHITHYQFRRDDFFFWILLSGTLDWFLNMGVIIPDNVVKETQMHYQAKQKNSKKKKIHFHFNSKVAIQNRIKEAIIPIMEKLLISPSYTLTQLENDPEYKIAVRNVKAHLNNEDNLKVKNYPSRSVLARLATPIRNKNKVEHKNASKH